MAQFLGKFTFGISILSLLHAAYSAAQHRAYLRLSEQDFTWLPLDIYVQALLSLYAAMYGILSMVGELKEIRATQGLESKNWDTLGNRPSFYMFNHRGRALSINYQPPSKRMQDLY